MGGQVAGAGRAAEDVGIIADAEARAINLGGQHPFHVFHTDLRKAAFDERASGPVGALAVAGQVQHSRADVDADLNLIVAEFGGFDGQTNAVAKLDERRAEVGDRAPLDDGAGRAERRVGPDHDVGGGSCCDRRLRRRCEGRK